MDYSNRTKSYFSPLKLWRQIQMIIRTNNEQEFERLCNDGDRALHMARVLLSQRLPNEDTMAPPSNNKYHIQQLTTTLQPQHHVHQLFGSSCRDLNALQMTLFLRHDNLAISILEFLQHHTSRTELLKFVNHPWGYGNSSLHLAAYLGMQNLVQLLLECGADTTHRNTKQHGPLDGCTKPACIQLLQQSYFDSPASITVNNNNDHIIKQHQKHPSITPKESSILVTDQPPTSLLLKKAVQQSLVRKDNDMATKSTKLPLLLSTSTSSSSSYSSLSSLEEPLSPSHSTQILDYSGNHRYCISPPPSPSPSPSKSPSRQYGSNNRRINKTMPYSPSHMNQPTQVTYRHLRSRLPPPPSSSSSSSSSDDYEIGCSTITTTTTIPVMESNVLSPDNSMTQPTRSSSLSTSSSSSKSVRFSPESILLDACMHGDIEDLMDLIKQQQQQHQQHAKPVRVLLQEWQDQQPIPILSFALLYRQESMVNYLLSLGVDVNATDPDGWAPLHYAATFQLWSSLVLLASHPGVLLEARTSSGLKVYECPRALADQRRCKVLIDRAKKRQKQP